MQRDCNYRRKCIHWLGSIEILFCINWPVTIVFDKESWKHFYIVGTFLFYILMIAIFLGEFAPVIHTLKTELHQLLEI